MPPSLQLQPSMHPLQLAVAVRAASAAGSRCASRPSLHSATRRCTWGRSRGASSSTRAPSRTRRSSRTRGTPASGHYIPVKGISVNWHGVDVAASLPNGALDLDGHTGRGGVVLSTVTPYTIMRAEVFRPLIQAFDDAITRLQREDDRCEACASAEAADQLRRTKDRPGAGRRQKQLDCVQ